MDQGGVTTKIPSAGDQRVVLLRYAAGWWWLVADRGRKLFVSSDGSSWVERTQAAPYSYTTWIDEDPNDGTARITCDNNSSGNTIKIRKSNNGGSTFYEWYTYPSVPSQGRYGQYTLQGDKMVLQMFEGVSYAAMGGTTQVVTLEGTDADYADFHVGDLVQPGGANNKPYNYNKVTDISGNKFTLEGEYLYKVGEILVAMSPTGTGLTSRYLKINSVRQIVGVMSGDPGFVEFGPSDDQVLEFPDEFENGKAPDVELPVGTTMKVFGRAENEVGYSEYGPSDPVTPT